jgi:hypothetical protein
MLASVMVFFISSVLDIGIGLERCGSKKTETSMSPLLVSGEAKLTGHWVG